MSLSPASPRSLYARTTASVRVPSFALFALILLAGAFLPHSSAAQAFTSGAALHAFADDSSSALPENPDPQIKNAPNATKSEPDPRNAEENAQVLQTKRILGLIPNFRAVSSSDKLPAQTPKEKFLTATDDSFDYSSVFIPSVLAGYGMARRSYPEFGDGADSYGKYLWHSAVDQTTENYMVEYVVPVMFHQDTRYYTLGHGKFLNRTGYALSRAVVTRHDNAREEFNISEVLGSGASAALSNVYYPARERSFSNTASAWGLDIAIDGASMFAKEFWPDINRHLFHTATVPTR